MSIPNPQAYQDGGLALLSTFAFGTVDAGSTSVTIAFEVWNSKGDAGADDAREVKLNIGSRPQGTSGWPINARPWVERWIQMRKVGAIGTADPTPTGWSPIGMARPFPCGLIPADSAILMEQRIVVPAGRTDLWEHEARLDYQSPAEALGAGHAAAGFRGVLSGLGDGDVSALLAGGVLAPSGPPDGNAVLGDVDWLWRGVPMTALAQTLTLNTTAADGALAAGEAYWAAVSVGGSGVTVTKGNGGATPLPASERPLVPGGERLLGYLEKPESGNVDTADVVNAQSYGRLLIYPESGLSVVMGYGEALADDCLVHYDKTSPFTLPDATTGGLVALVGPTGEREVAASGVPANPRAEPLARFTTAGGVVTSLVDLRSSPSPRRCELRFRFGATLASGKKFYATAPATGRLYLAIPDPVVAVLDDAGATGGSSGRTAFLVDYWDGAAWTSIFATSPDRRPAIAYNASDPRGTGKPTLTVFDPGTRFRARCTEIPTGGTSAPGAEVVLTGEIA